DRLFDAGFLGQLTTLFMCGTYGDASVARDCLPIWERIHAANPHAFTCMHTNGGARGPDWWAKLARSCRSVWFGIDGLEDTNHLYRQNVSWKRLMANARAYIGAGGRATWVMNVFRHNEHQVEEARRFATEAGFVEFIVRKTARFYWPERGAVS